MNYDDYYQECNLRSATEKCLINWTAALLYIKSEQLKGIVEK